ncbi:MAG: 2,3-bisphosphoglycerate-dependent phosphoglycerate mutase, partial [Clostridia bacterium]|nr:2,3-bisphosphoglycerate-dependent phosphoglycerate mutase [Clostridia bacterium]
RRSFDVCPPELSDDDERNPKNQETYKNVDPALLPNTESLETCIERVVPYYKDVITKDIAAGKKVLIAAHGNSLRSLVMYLDDMTPEEILETNIPTAVPLVYELDDNFKAISHHYLLSEEELKARMEAVANQGKAK